MSAPLFSNNASSELGAGLSSTATSVQLIAGGGAKFPVPTGGQWFNATLFSPEGSFEIVRCTGRSGDILTVVRGQEGTAAVAWPSGTRIELRVTAGVLNALMPKSGGTFTGSVTVPAASVTGNLTVGGVVYGTTEGTHRGPVEGNVVGNVTGNVTGTSLNVTGVVQIANGGTGATTAAAARTALGLASWVTGAEGLSTDLLTSGVLPVARGGTGGATVQDARSSLGLGTLAIKNNVNLATDVATDSPPLPTVRGGSGLSNPVGFIRFNGVGSPQALEKLNPSHLEGLAASATVDATNANNITSGLLALARMGVTQTQAAAGGFSLSNSVALRWGPVNTGVFTEGSGSATFVTPFSTACYGVVATVLNSGQSGSMDTTIQIVSTSTTGFTYYRQVVGTSSVPVSFFYIAVGS